MVSIIAFPNSLLFLSFQLFHHCIFCITSVILRNSFATPETHYQRKVKFIFQNWFIPPIGTNFSFNMLHELSQYHNLHDRKSFSISMHISFLIFIGHYFMARKLCYQLKLLQYLERCFNLIRTSVFLHYQMFKFCIQNHYLHLYLRLD